MMGWTQALVMAASLGLDVAQRSAQSRAAASAANFQAAISQRQAVRDSQLAQLHEQEIRQTTDRRVGHMRALLASRGLDPSAGTALLLQEQERSEGELDARTALAQGLYRGQLAEDEAALGRFTAASRRRLGNLAIGNTLLTGARRFGRSPEGLG